MSTPFRELLNLLINGQDKEAKKKLKSFSRETRYDFVTWLSVQIELKQYKNKVIKWCILGKWK